MSPTTVPAPRRAAAGALAIAPFAVVLLAGVLLPAPELVPVHWGLAGVDGVASGAAAHGVVLAVSGLGAVGAAIVSVLGAAVPPAWSRWAVTGLAAVGAAAAGWAVLVTLATAAAGGPEGVAVGWALLPLPVAAGWAWLTFWTHGRSRPERAAVLVTVPERSRVVPPAPGEPLPPVARWQAPSANPAMLAAAVFAVLVLGGSAVLLAATAEMAAAAVVGLLAVALGGFAVAWARTEMVVDEDGLRVRSRVLPVQLLSVAPGDVLGVETRWLEPARWGGWGLRAAPGRTAYIVRGGAGLVVYRADGRLLALEIVQGQEEALAAGEALRVVARAGPAG